MVNPETVDQALASWVTNAKFWDEAVGQDGNIYWRKLQEPSLQRLLSGKIRSTPGCRALDLCTGNGLCARWLADQGATSVTATDGSTGMLEVARARITEDRYACIDLGLLDVSSPADFERLVQKAADFGGYDVILMNMAIQDVPTLDPLVQALPKLLKKDGLFVGTLLHPVFLTSGAPRNVKLTWDQTTGELVVERTRIIKDYMSIPPYKGVAMPGQPAKQIYFHRPIYAVFAPFFGAGLVMDGMEELAFSENDADPDKIESSTNFPQIPAIMAFRMRRGAD